MKHFLLFASTCTVFSLNAQMGFTPNEGQFADQGGTPASNVLFRACGTGPGIFITTEGLTYVFSRERAVSDRDEDAALKVTDWSAIHMKLVGANISKDNVIMEDELPGVSNYYYAHCPQGVLNVKSYHKVTIRNVYPGIDWVFTADDVNGMAHDFIVAANANHKLIRMQYSGLTAPITMNESNQLSLVSEFGTMHEGGLKVYRSETNQPVPAFFSVNGNEVSFLITRRIGHCGLVIDPPLQWATTHASSNFDYGYSVVAAKDGTGDSFFTGESDGTDFPVLNAFQGMLFGFEDMVVVRVDANGTRLWSTYYGGTGYEVGRGVATDNSGNCYVVGTTNSSNLPVQNSLQANYGGGTYDAFIAKFNSTGVRQWASWRGGLSTDYGNAIVSDGAGFVYVTGYTNSAVFPNLNAIQTGNNGGYDAFIFKVDASQTLLWSTNYGGDDDDKGRGIALDATGANVYVTGSTLSGTFPSTSGVFQQSSASAYNAEDAFIVKISVAQVVQFSSHCGGTDAEFGQGVTVDNLGNVYITGYTLSGDFPVADPGNGAYVDSTQQSIGTHDAFVAKCNSTGSTLLWSTYFGGTFPDMGFAIVADQNYGVYICGNTGSTDFPVMQPADLNYYQSTQGDAGTYNDMFIAWFDINDSLRWSTYYGDANGNEAYGISVGMSNEIFVIGVDSNDVALLKFNPGMPTNNTLQVCGYGQYGPYPFPNPATDVVSLSFWTNEGTTSIEIIDMTGRVVQRNSVSTVSGENILRIDVSELAAGNYHLNVRSEVGTRDYQFVKQ